MTATLTINTQLNGIEIKFDSKPITATLDSLKKLGFRWHNQKKLWYAKNTPERLELAQIITKTDNYAQQVKKEEPKAKAEPVNKYGVKVGDVFYESWGYEQTNIDFYQVVALRGVSQIILREIGAEHRNIGFCSDMVKPIKDNFRSEEEVRKTVKGTPENPYCNAEHGLLYKTTWDAEHNETSYY